MADSNGVLAGKWTVSYIAKNEFILTSGRIQWEDNLRFEGGSPPFVLGCFCLTLKFESLQSLTWDGQTCSWDTNG